MKIALSVIGIVGVIALAVYVFAMPAEVVNAPENHTAVAPADLALNRSEVADALERRIIEISPTPASGDIGWVARTIDFVEGKPMAYVEYTDTHLLLRMLVQYKATNPIDFFVLATFTPTSSGSWLLDNGQDIAKNDDLIPYIYDQGAGKWVEE